MFAKLKAKLSGASKKVSGRLDFLEAVCAASALVAAADGDVSREEEKAAKDAIAASSVLSNAFKANQIAKTADTMFARALQGRTGRLGLYKEIDDIASNDELGEIVYTTALDIAEADGNICDKESAVLEKIAGRLGVNPANFDV